MARRQRTKLNRTPVTAKIETFSHDGRGIARVGGKATFIQGALPNETVTFEYTLKKKDFDEGKLLEVIEASSERVEAKCHHYTLCGACSMQHLSSDKQIEIKQQQLFDQLSRIGHCQPDNKLAPLTSSAWHYRNKARLSVRFVEKKNGVLVGFRERGNPRFITEINQCAILNKKVSDQIVNIRQLLVGFSDPQCIAQVEVSASDEEVGLIFRNLTALTSSDEERLIQFAKDTSFKVFLQPGGTDSVELFYPNDGDEYLTYRLPDEDLLFKFHPTDFTQVNAKINQLMIKDALELLDLKSDDVVLDLFCGLGNFSLPLAKRAAKVVGVEGSQTMVERATMNARLNKLTNTEFFCANLEDEKSYSIFNRYKFSKLLLDPARTGAFEVVKNINLINPKSIVYVSCNPATLARDADVLVNRFGYHLQSAGVMDMFPNTAHVESVALFVKR